MLIHLDVRFAFVADLLHNSQQLELMKRTPSNVERVLCIRHVALREAVPLLVRLKVSRLGKILERNGVVVEYVLCGELENLLRNSSKSPTNNHGFGAPRPQASSSARRVAIVFVEVLSILLVCFSQVPSVHLNHVVGPQLSVLVFVVSDAERFRVKVIKTLTAALK